MLLQTTFTEVSNLQHSQKEKVHILCGNGNHSYMSHKLRKQLRLTNICTKRSKLKHWQ